MVLKISRKICYVKPNVQSISYFNNGLSRMELSPKTIEDCLTKQLMLYIDGDVSKYEEINLRSIMYKALRRAKSQHRSFIQLRIVDAYFHLEDFLIIKKFFDINNDLNVNILTHKQKYPDIDVFHKGWNRVSADMTGSISIQQYALMMILALVLYMIDGGYCTIMRQVKALV